MKKKKKQKQAGITIGIKGIRFLHFEPTSRVQELTKQLPPEMYEFQLDMESQIVEHEKLFNVQMSVTLYEKQGVSTKIELATMKTLTSFNIVNLNELILKENGLITIPDQVILVATGIAVSTTRGMFVMSVKDSIINNAVIPIINPQVFLPKKDIKNA